jgi:beta-phosphoglucomutase-like phosphatase (HAD superfamily)
MKNSKTIALDCDGVLLDYALAYGGAWKRAFGEEPVLRSPDSYWPMDRWGTPRLSGSTLGSSNVGGHAQLREFDAH